MKRGWAAAVALVLAVVWARVYFDARGELAVAVAAEAEGDLDAAIEHYQYALRAYSPGAAAPIEAADALWRIGAEADDRARALKALRRLRGGILAIRSLYSPLGDRLEPLNQRLAELTADEQLALGQPTIRGRDRAQLVADHLALLRLDPRPAVGWSLLVTLGFVGWVAGAFLVIWRGFDADARLLKPQALRWGAFTAVCFAAWVVGLIYA